MIEQVKMVDVLTSLSPGDQEELSILRSMIEYAQSLRNGTHHLESAFNRENHLVLATRTVSKLASEPRQFLSTIPHGAERYFHGLIEALEIYESIHGIKLCAHNIHLSDASVKELRQIRDLCLEEGLHSMV